MVWSDLTDYMLERRTQHVDLPHSNVELHATFPYILNCRALAGPSIDLQDL